MRYINHSSNSVFLRVFTLFILCSVSAVASAEQSYQFSLGGSLSYVDFEPGGKSKVYALNGAAYLDPVILDGSRPYASAALYQRVAGVFVGTYRYKTKDFNLVRAGRILKKIRWLQ